MPLIGLFGQKVPKTSATRFDRTDELRHVNTLISQIRSRSVDIASDAICQGQGSVAETKYGVISEFIKNFDIELNRFNAKPVPDDETACLQEIVELSAALSQIVKSTLESSRAEIGQLRNNDRERASMYTGASIVGPVAIAALFTPWTFVQGAVGLSLALLAGSGITQVLGLKSIEAVSLEKMIELDKTLDAIMTNLQIRPATPALA